MGASLRVVIDRCPGPGHDPCSCACQKDGFARSAAGYNRAPIKAVNNKKPGEETMKPPQPRSRFALAATSGARMPRFPTTSSRSACYGHVELYADATGRLTGRYAVADYGGKVKGKLPKWSPPTTRTFRRRHQHRAQLYDNDKVDAIFDVPTSLGGAVASALHARRTIGINSGGGLPTLRRVVAAQHRALTYDTCVRCRTSQAERWSSAATTPGSSSLPTCFGMARWRLPRQRRQGKRRRCWRCPHPELIQFPPSCWAQAPRPRYWRTPAAIPLNALKQAAEFGIMEAGRR